ncbi:MAG: hypothetical protein WCJ37_11965 [Syntrophus sp. (in: bacteria)]
MKCLVLYFSVFLLMSLLVPYNGLADEGCEMPPPQKLTAYPGSVSTVEGQTPPYRDRLAKPRLVEVKSYYPDTSVEEAADSGIKTVKLYQRISACGKTKDALLLNIQARTNDDPNVAQAFTALQGMTMMGLRSPAELKQAKSQYGDVLKAFFRTVNTKEGGSEDEGRMILNKYLKLEKQQRNQPARGASQDKERAAEMRKKMQAMKASGDYAGMQQLATQYQGRAKQDPSVQQAQQEMKRDLWELWIQCLQEMKAVAYYTRLSYQYEISE